VVLKLFIAFLPEKSFGKKITVTVKKQLSRGAGQEADIFIKTA